MTFEPSSLWFSPTIVSIAAIIFAALGAVGLLFSIGAIMDIIVRIRHRKPVKANDLAAELGVLTATASLLFGLVFANNALHSDIEDGQEALTAAVKETYGLALSENIINELAPTSFFFFTFDGTLWNLHHGLGDMKRSPTTTGGVVDFVVGERSYSTQLVWHGDEWRLVRGDNDAQLPLVRDVEPQDVGNADGEEN